MKAPSRQTKQASAATYHIPATAVSLGNAAEQMGLPTTPALQPWPDGPNNLDNMAPAAVEKKEVRPLI